LLNLLSIAIALVSLPGPLVKFLKSEIPLSFIIVPTPANGSLDINLGREIAGIKREVIVPLAILTNASLLFLEDVRNDLYEADTVSVKLDACSEEVFRKINRPHPKLKLNEILDGILCFSKNFKGKLITETMIVKGVNDSSSEMEKVAEFISKLKPHKAYIAVPTRPPAEKWVKQPSEQKLLKIYKIFEKHIPEKAELLIGYEGESFRIDREKPVESILAITSVHPMRIDYAEKLLEKAGLNPEETLSKLISEGKITILEYGNYRFIMRKIHPIR